MNIDGVEFTPVSPETRDEIVDRAIDRVSRDADSVPAAAVEVWRATAMPVADIVDRLIDHAPVMEPAEEKKVRKRALKAARKIRDVTTRAYVAPQPGELERRAAFDEAAERERTRRAVRRALDAEEATSDEEPDDYADGAAILDRIQDNGGAETRLPDAGGIVNDGGRLGYRGKTHSVLGEPESGKTLVVVAMACDELKLGGSVLHLDADDNGEEDTYALYLAFGADPDVLRDPERFRYSAVRTADGARKFVRDAAEWCPTMTILDAVAPLMALFGLNPDDNSDYRSWHAELPARLSAAGSSVWQIDHVNKANGDSRYATGAGQKLGAMSGVQYGATLIEPFVPGVGGASALKILKDRPGGVRAASPTGKTPTAAVFRLDSRGGSSSWEFWRGKSSEEQGDDQAEADVEHVLGMDPFPDSRPKLMAAIKASQGVGWSSGRAYAALTEARRRREAPLVQFDLNNKQIKE